VEASSQQGASLMELVERTGVDKSTVTRLLQATAGFHRRAGDRRVAIAGVESHHDVRRGFNAGESCSLLVGPSSKAILAFLPEVERSGMLAAGGSAGADLAEVERHIAFLREHHYLSTDSDRTAGVGAIAAPVFDASGVVGSVVSSGPVTRFDEPARERARKAILAAADTISLALGGRRLRDLP
jgi:DNA-binding IclR family transcriptional regulator